MFIKNMRSLKKVATFIKKFD